MKKKILGIGIVAILISMLVVLTGCGSETKNNKQKNNEPEYTDAIIEFRNSAVGALGDETFGSLLDKALENAKWTENEDYSFVDGGAIIITGNDKNTGDNVELIWLTKPVSGENGFEKMTKGNEDIGYSAFLSYLLEYED
jgi:hypothetical protein